MNLSSGRLPLLLAALTLVATLQACTPAKENPLPTKSAADATALVKMHADATALNLGSALEKYDAVKVACEGQGGEVATDGRFNISGHANIRLPEGTHVKALEGLRDKWTAQGYEIRQFRTLPGNDRGELAARKSADGVQVSLTSTDSPTALALLVLTPCYMPPAA